MLTTEIISSPPHTKGRFDHINEQLRLLRTPTLASSIEFIGINKESPLARICTGIVEPDAQLLTVINGKPQRSRSHGRLIIPFSHHIVWKNADRFPLSHEELTGPSASLQTLGARLLSQSPASPSYFRERITDPDLDLRKLIVVIGNQESITFARILAESFGIDTDVVEEYAKTHLQDFTV